MLDLIFIDVVRFSFRYEIAWDPTGANLMIKSCFKTSFVDFRIFKSACKSWRSYFEDILKNEWITLLIINDDQPISYHWSLSIPPGKIWKPLVFCFQRVWKKIRAIISWKESSNLYLRVLGCLNKFYILVSNDIFHEVSNFVKMLCWYSFSCSGSK